MTRGVSDSVLDYALVSAGLLPQTRSFFVDDVVEVQGYSDHSTICAVLTSNGDLETCDAGRAQQPASSVADWAFLDVLAKEDEGKYAKTVL